MPTITFVSQAGRRYAVTADHGLSVMEIARRNEIPGIDADCGGNCACGTCHVYVGNEWIERVGRPGPSEEAMLEFVHQPADTSRLSCQITMRQELDGLELLLPERQGL
jgi:ferredoxin, 2Fe-2S